MATEISNCPKCGNKFVSHENEIELLCPACRYTENEPVKVLEDISEAD